MATKEILDNITSPFRVKLLDPVVGAYIYSFVIYNWEIFVILFSSLPVLGKIDYIKNLFWPSFVGLETFWEWSCWFWSVSLGYALVFPALMTCIYIYVLPQLFKKYAIYSKIEKNKVDRANAKADAELGIQSVAMQIRSLKTENRRLQDEANQFKSSGESQEKLIKNLETEKRALGIELEKISKEKQKSVEESDREKQINNYRDILAEYKLSKEMLKGVRAFGEKEKLSVEVAKSEYYRSIKTLIESILGELSFHRATSHVEQVYNNYKNQDPNPQNLNYISTHIEKLKKIRDIKPRERNIILLSQELISLLIAYSG